MNLIKAVASINLGIPRLFLRMLWLEQAITSFSRKKQALPGLGLWVSAGQTVSNGSAVTCWLPPTRPTLQRRTHLLVTCAVAGSSHPQGHLQPRVQGPLGGTCSILLGWRAVGNIHGHSRGGVDAEGCVALGGRAGEDREPQWGRAWPTTALPSIPPFPKCKHQMAAGLPLTVGVSMWGCQEVARNRKKIPWLGGLHSNQGNCREMCTPKTHTHGCEHRAMCTPRGLRLTDVHTQGCATRRESHRLLLLELWQTSALKNLPLENNWSVVKIDFLKHGWDREKWEKSPGTPFSACAPMHTPQRLNWGTPKTKRRSEGDPERKVRSPIKEQKSDWKQTSQQQQQNLKKQLNSIFKVFWRK